MRIGDTDSVQVRWTGVAPRSAGACISPTKALPAATRVGDRKQEEGAQVPLRGVGASPVILGPKERPVRAEPEDQRSLPMRDEAQLYPAQILGRKQVSLWRMPLTGQCRGIFRSPGSFVSGTHLPNTYVSKKGRPALAGRPFSV